MGGNFPSRALSKTIDSEECFVKNMAISENHLYKKVYAKGEKVFCRHTVVYVLTDYHAARLARANPSKKKLNRLGLAVSKKIGGAVVRSRVRRILRTAYRQLETEYEIKKGLLFVISAKHSAADAKTQDIYADLLYAAKKLGIMPRGEAK